MDLVFKIAGIGIIVAVLNQLLVRSGREEMAMLMTITSLTVALLIVVEEISKLFEYIKVTFGF